MSGAVEGVALPDSELIYQALRFFYWSAGQGVSPINTDDAAEPEETFWQYGLRTGDEEWETVAERYRASLTTPPARSYADGVRQWFPHLCFAGEPMRKGQFREPWPMEEERTALAKAIFDGWYEGNEDWDSPHNDHLQMRAYFAADAAIRLLSQGGKA